MGHPALFIHISLELEVPIVLELRCVLNCIPRKLHCLLRIFQDRLIMDILYFPLFAFRSGLDLLAGLINLGLG